MTRKGCPQLLLLPVAGRGRDRLSPRACRRSTAPLTPRLGTSGPRAVGEQELSAALGPPAGGELSEQPQVGSPTGTGRSVTAVRPALTWPVTALTPSGLQSCVWPTWTCSPQLFQVLHEDSFASTALGGRGQTYEGSLWVLCYNCMCTYISSVQFGSVAQSCPTLCNPMTRSTPGLPVHHQFLEFTQTHVHRVGDAIQPSHPVVPFSSCPQSLPASESFPMSQHFA